jgi:hypothetical protein
MIEQQERIRGQNKVLMVEQQMLLINSYPVEKEFTLYTH